MEHSVFHFFDISFYDINLLSLVLGMFFGATMWRVKSMYFVAIYFVILAATYGVKYYVQLELAAKGIAQ